MTDSELLARLIENMYEDKDELHWSWKEDVSLKEIDPKLNDALINRFKREFALEQT